MKERIQILFAIFVFLNLILGTMYFWKHVMGL